MQQITRRERVFKKGDTYAEYIVLNKRVIGMTTSVMARCHIRCISEHTSKVMKRIYVTRIEFGIIYAISFYENREKSNWPIKFIGIEIHARIIPRPNI